MIYTKKIIITLFFFLFSFAIASPQPVFAADQFTPSVSFQFDKAALSGRSDTVNATLVLDTPLDPYNISSFNLQVLYDKDVLEAASVDTAGPFNAVITSQIDNENGNVHFASATTSINKISGKVPLATIAFHGKKNGYTIIKFNSVKVYSTSQTEAISITPQDSSALQISGISPSTLPYAAPTPDCFQNGVAGKKTDLGCVPQNPTLLITSLYGYGLGIIGGVSLLLLIYSGFLILTSKGNSEMLGRAKSYMSYAIGGLLLAIFGYAFVQIIAVNVLHVPGFK